MFSRYVVHGELRNTRMPGKEPAKGGEGKRTTPKELEKAQDALNTSSRCHSRNSRCGRSARPAGSVLRYARRRTEPRILVPGSSPRVRASYHQACGFPI